MIVAIIAIIIVIIKLTNFEPVNPDTVKNVHVQVANLAEYSFDVNLSQRQSIEKIVELEALLYDIKGVNGLANAVTWRINLTYFTQNGKELKRAYKGQGSTNILISNLTSIDELVVQTNLS